MSSYQQEMENQNHLIELGKQLNVKETLKTNQENYLEIALKEIENKKYLEIEEQINLIESYESNIERIRRSFNYEIMEKVKKNAAVYSQLYLILQQAKSSKHHAMHIIKGNFNEDSHNIDNNLLLSLIDKQDEKLFVLMMCCILFKLKTANLIKEIVLLNETEEDINDQYNEVIEELDEKDKELKLSIDNFNNFKFNSGILFIVYNYLIYFSLDDIISHFTFVFSTIYNLSFTFFSNYFINFVMLILIISGVGAIYEKMCKYKND
jgi:hypothetical protein